MKLKFKNSQIQELAKRYGYPSNEDAVTSLAPLIKEQNYVTKNQLQILCKWKSPRSAGNMLSNDEEYIKEITKYSFQTKNERTRIEVLTLLDGVRWPTASCILHLFHNDKYPILDFRALWSIGIDKPPDYKYDFWINYTNFCRNISKEQNISMRNLDKALWQYSKENQQQV